MFKFELGSRLKHKITGFKGVVTGRHEWLSNCNTYSLRPEKLDKEGKPLDTVAFDEPELEEVDKKKKKFKVWGIRFERLSTLNLFKAVVNTSLLPVVLTAN